MKITCSDIAKKYQGQWIFSGFSFLFSEGSKTAIIGFNGSGKSTLLSILSGYTTPNKGSILHEVNNIEIAKDSVYKYFSIGSPYLELPEELNSMELINTFKNFKPFSENLNTKEILDLLMLDTNQDKPVKYFSSGMKQRLKIGMAILSDTPLLLLDEPLSNLDQEGCRWFENLMNNYINKKTVIIASNKVEAEIKHCDTTIDISEYKKS